MIALALLAGCRPGTALLVDLELEVEPSAWAPAAFRVSWTGPAGGATLWAIDPAEASAAELHGSPGESDGPWRRVSSAEVEAGTSSLPLALLPAGRDWRFRLGLATGSAMIWSALGEIRIPEPPVLLGTTELAYVDSDASAVDDGWVISHRYALARDPGSAFPVILDGRGEIVWWLDPLPGGQRAIRVRPSRDLRSVLVLEDHDTGEDLVLRVRLDGSARVVTPTPDVSHDFFENTDGTLTWIAYQTSPAGTIPGVPWPVAADVLRTVAEGETDRSRIVDGFGFLDDYPADPALLCLHTEPDRFVAGAVDWTHANSLVRAPADDGWLLMSRHLDALLFVRDDGTLVWQAGGTDSTLAMGPDAAFEHGHTSDAWLEDGVVHVLVFDNGDHSPLPIVSRVLELAIDADAGTVERVWDLPDPEGRFSGFLGDARRLPGGTTLVTWTPYRELVEYTPAGEEVWRLLSTEKLGRSTWIPELRP